MTTRLNFHIGNGHTPAYESFQVESVQSSPSSTQRRSRTASGASSLPSTFGDIEFTSRRKRQHSRSSSVASSLDFDYSDDGYYRYNHDEGEDTDHTDTEHEYASNERLLLIAFFTFMSFSVTQLYFAFRAQSEAMKGDSAAMMVDSLTYLFNFCAERAKHNVELPLRDTLTQSTSIKVLSKHQQERNKRKRVLQLEILPPLISVTTLLIVTAVVLRDSLRVIWWDLAAQHSLNYHVQGDPNIELMLMFALINLGLDVVNFGCFARASHLFGYDTSDIAGSERHAHTHRSLLPQHGSGDDDNNNNNNNNYALNASEWRHEMDEMNGDSGHDDEEYDDDEEDSEGEDDHRPHANLNMVGGNRNSHGFSAH